MQYVVKTKNYNVTLKNVVVPIYIIHICILYIHIHKILFVVLYEPEGSNFLSVFIRSSVVPIPLVYTIEF